MSFLSLRRAFANFLCGLLPATRCYNVKNMIWRMAGVEIGKGVRLVSSVKIHTSGPVHIDDYAFIGHEGILVGGDAPIKIGAHVGIAPRVCIVTGSHKIDLETPSIAGEGYSAPISIGEGCWIGASVTILGGTEIGEKCVLAAGAVVTESIPEYSVVGGVPAKIIKTLEKDQ